MPHPLVTIGGILILAAFFTMAYGTDLRPSPLVQAVFLLVFVWTFRVVSRRSARRMSERRAQELQKLKEQSIFHLED